ncbi:chemotaxis protein methyltransferase CheR [Thermodesulfovibrio aggregans]|uniref:protein-glutamate O-methyltransferase n=1 Tax=Thermodesulfovibrio aggregans TaxID=86166 RepID=A0A0U9HM89_9BACT|nr:protein-glutamate O-methyltransferase CheR [Thermodesulfovibrio aggregans]GAQ94231.1 chemotaxis protein methyltransferase CheR [Thermodesulfovibrio aggregans]
MTTLTASSSLSINDEVFRQLRDFIYEKTGIYVPDNKKYFLENRLSRILKEKNFRSYEDYLYFLRYSANKHDIAKLFDAITTNETFFFREPQQFEVFSNNLVPQIIKENSQMGRKDIKIWSAACSTGEEPYTIAMILLEKPELVSFRKEIYASDISESVLMSARKGMYGSYSIRNVPPQYMAKYFKDSGGVYVLSETVKSMVKFMNINLIEEKEVKQLKGIDVVFCRNVLIYFDEKAKKKAVSLIYDVLRPKGYLFVGTSESLHNITRAFRPVVINKVVVYQKV